MSGSLPSPAEALVREAAEAVYNVITEPRPSKIEGCPCCTDPRNVDVLLATPLRQLSGGQMWRYVTSLFLTIGCEQDFRYFLPRILEVTALDPGDSPNVEIVLGKLRLAAWRSWKSREQRAIEAFADAWFELALARDLAEADQGWVGQEAEGLLCGAARAGIPLDRWLVRLHEPDAAPVLNDLKLRFPANMSPFWEDDPEGLAELSTILTQGQA